MLRIQEIVHIQELQTRKLETLLHDVLEEHFD